MSGYPGDLSTKQSAALDQFKINVKDVMKPEFDDHYLLRWLRARAWDLKKSEKMLRDSLAWRKSYGADTLVEDYTPLEVLVKYYPGGYFGVDKEGSPTWIDCLGTVDLKGMYFSAKKAEIIRFRMQRVENLVQNTLPELSKKYSRKIDQCNMIFDMEGIGLKHLWKPAIDLFTEALRILEANYPELLKTCYVVNAPKIFPIAYNLAKPFLSEDTKKKIHVLGRDYKTVLLKHYDPEELPVAYGGTATDPDGDIYCRSKVCRGGEIPEKYKKNKPDVDLSKFTTSSVDRGSTLQVTADVPEAGDVLSWQFWTEGMDIGFGVFRRTKDSRQKAEEMEVVVQSERVNSHVIPEDGSITCDQAGTYVLRFDNTYSWMNSKKVQYMVEVYTPDEDFVTAM